MEGYSKMTDVFSLLGFWMPGPLETIFILAVLVLLFGRKLPEIARNMGKSLNEFKKGIKESEQEIHKAIDEADETSDEAAKTSSSPESEDKN